MHTLLNVILALSQLATTPEGQVVLTAVGGFLYDMTRRYSKTKLPASFLWDLHRSLKWISQVSANAATAMDRTVGQRTDETKPQ